MNVKLSKTITHVNTLMTLFIVAMHTTWPEETRLRPLLVLTNMAVPTFFFLSAFLYFKDWTPTWQCYKNKLCSRFYSLLIPYISYNVIFYLYYCVKIYLLHKTTAKVMPTDPVGAIICILSGIPDGVLWYVQDLMVFVVIAPLLGILIRHSKIWLIPILLGSVICPSLSYFNLFYWTPWLAVGAYCALYVQDVGKFVEPVRKRLSGNNLIGVVLLMSLVAVCMLVSMQEDNAVLDYLCRIVLTVLLALFCCVWQKILPSWFVVRVSPLCFFIYCSHPAFTDVAKAVIQPLMSEIPYQITYSVMLMSVLISVIISGMLLQRIPWLWSLLSGFRSKKTSIVR